MQKPAMWFLGVLLLVASSAVATPVSAATVYTSPTYDFTLTLPDEWTVQSETSENGTDVLRFTNGPVVAFLTSFPTEQTPAECIDDQVETIQQRPGHDNFAFATPVQESAGSATGVLGYTFITAAGEQLEGRNRMTCWTLDDADAMVRLEFLLLSRDMTAQDAAMSVIETELEAAVQAEGTPEAVIPEATPIETATATETTTAAVATATTEAATATAVATATAEATATELATATDEATATEDATAAEEVTPTEEATATDIPATAEPTGTPITESSAQPSPTGSIGEPPLPPALEQPGVAGNSYVSPNFGYGLTWTPEWTVGDAASDTRGDYLGLEHADGIFADLIGEPYPADRGSCFDFIVDYYTQNEDYQNVVGTMDPTSAAPGLWEYSGTITMVFVSDSGSQVDLLNYVACSHIPDQAAIVSLEQVIRPTDLTVLQPEMDALRQGFVLSTSVAPMETAGPAATPEGAATAASTASVETTQTAGSTAVATGGVSGNTYTSPTWNYALTWGDTWSVVEESSEGGEDYLKLSNGMVTAELLSEQWTPGQENCFEWIVNFYANNPDYSNVRASQDAVSASDGVWEYTGAIALNLLEADDRPAGERINYVACSELPGQQVIVSLEQFVWPIDAPGQLSAMDTLRDGFSLEAA